VGRMELASLWQAAGSRTTRGGACRTGEREGGGEADGETDLVMFWSASADGVAGSLCDGADGGGHVSDESIDGGRLSVYT
jgi:hypothetical protein